MCAFCDRRFPTGRITLFKDSDFSVFLGIESEMVTAAKSGVQMLLLMIAASTALLAQSSGPATPQNSASVGDARQVVLPSVLATERSWAMRDHYTYMERDDDRRLNSLGQLKSESVDVTKMMLVNGARFEQLLEHNGQVPSAKEQKRSDEDLEKLKHETPDEQTARLRKDQENRAFLQDILEAFDFRLVGEETIGGRPAYVLHATPHPGYRAHGKYAKMFSRVEGRLWVDKQDFGWIKVDGQVTQSFSLGLILARVERGSHIIMEQTSVGDGVWVPKRIEIRATARILLLKSLDIQRTLTYTDYRPESDGTFSVSR